MMIFRKTEDVTIRKVAGETLLIPIKGQLADLHRVFALNSVAEWIWEQLDGKRKQSEICDGLIARFNVERTVAETDLNELLNKLEKSGLITRCE